MGIKAEDRAVSQHRNLRVGVNGPNDKKCSKMFADGVGGGYTATGSASSRRKINENRAHSVLVGCPFKALGILLLIPSIYPLVLALRISYPLLILILRRSLIRAVQ